MLEGFSPVHCMNITAWNHQAIRIKCNIKCITRWWLCKNHLANVNNSIFKLDDLFRLKAFTPPLPHFNPILDGNIFIHVTCKVKDRKVVIKALQNFASGVLLGLHI